MRSEPAPQRRLTDVFDAGAAILPAARDLVVALKNMPGPLWNHLITAHDAQRHEAKEAAPTQACVVCAFDAVVRAAGVDRPNRPQGQFKGLFPDTPKRQAKLSSDADVTVALPHEVEPTRPIERPPLDALIFGTVTGRIAGEVMP